MPSDSDWEAAWAPYDEPTYRAALELLTPGDVVLDIGAGDLRFARRAAARTRAVIAIEQRAELLTGADGLHSDMPNLTVICGNALVVPFPRGLTVAVLLMRHCRHVRKYVDKLLAVGCSRLITNARWGMSVELIDLLAPRVPLENVRAGWYACLCGATGFVEALPDLIDAAALERVREVDWCQKCV